VDLRGTRGALAAAAVLFGVAVAALAGVGRKADSLRDVVRFVQPRSR